jgi:hypothetical protein
MPNRFSPLSSKASLQSVIRQTNDNFRQLDAEANSKTIIAGGGKNAMLSGRLPNGRYGEVFYDSTGTARILIGQAPKDGRPGIWVTKPGFDVLREVN